MGAGAGAAAWGTAAAPFPVRGMGGTPGHRHAAALRRSRASGCRGPLTRVDPAS